MTDESVSAGLLGIEDPALQRLAKEYFQLLMAGDRKRASEIVLKAVSDGTDIRDIYLQVFQPVQYEVGRLWQANEISVATEHYCTAATQLIMSQLFPHIAGTPKHGRSMVGCCVGGELHELGMRMVCDFFELQGWHTYFLGANTPDRDVVRMVQERRANLLGVSVALTSNVHLVRRLTSRVRQTPGLERLPIMVGGLPFLINPGLVARVGGNASARDARDAVTRAEQLLEREA
ncbi:MAG: cobalamin-dependent protein [Desulfovibrio sp.]|jgi:methanogenic corrinoid protein MtbC1|nr:cobalamin-dependent protein [Desulfovibrio sp.]